MAIPRITITYAARYVTGYLTVTSIPGFITQMGVEANSDFVIVSHNPRIHQGICPSCKDSLKSL